jgi:capsular exopolysaccharide synthesis family protein
MADQIERIIAAIKRYRWLIAAIIAVGSTVGFLLTRAVEPKYQVNAAIWIARGGEKNGPISAPGLISNDLAWPELAKSFLVLDNVVSRLALYVEPANPADTLLYRGLLPTDSLKTGSYNLRIDAAGKRYELLRRKDEIRPADQVVERGSVGDSVGHSIGVQWAPPTSMMKPGHLSQFVGVTPREASRALSATMTVSLPLGSNLMSIALTGEQPGLMATTLNTLIHVFVEEAGRLKKENLTTAANTVQEQLAQARQQLTNNELQLEAFKINTITLPSENMAISPGVSTTMNPVMSSFFSDRVTFDVARRDREAVEAILSDAQRKGGRVSIEALKAVPAAVTLNQNLQTAITELLTGQVQLRKLRDKYTDEFQLVKDTKTQIDRLETAVIPKELNSSLSVLRAQENEMQRRITGASTELRRIPARTIEEARLKREVDISEKIVADLQARQVASKLAELTTQPDVAILDSAVAPRRPTSDTATSIFLVALAASVGLAFGLALLLDRADRRFRYPEQATNELGLDIVGAVPTQLRNVRNSMALLQNRTQMVESFRSLALSVRGAFNGTGPIQLTVTSPGAGDGKSFVSANLALALADGGYKTILVDGDVRRGALHKISGFEVDQSPGLVEHLAGEAALNEVIRPTSHQFLSLIPCGMRTQQAPELLASERMERLVRDLGRQYDAIIVDSAPLGAGIDAFALGSATKNLVLVLRTGETDRRLAQAKLTVLDRMPIRIVGAVLNDIGDNPQFRYYAYVEGYGALDRAEPSEALIGDGKSR